VRQLAGRVPATDPPQVIVALQNLQQLACGRETVHHFADKGTGCQAISRRPAFRASRAGDESRQGNHFPDRDQPFGGVAQFSQFLFQVRERASLQDLDKLRDLLP